MTQLLQALRSLPTADPSRTVRITTLILSLAIGTTGFLQAVSHPESYLPLHIAFFALIILWAALYYTTYRHSVYALCTLILLSSAYYNLASALLVFFILAITFLFVLTGPLPGIILLTISHTAGEIITAYALQQPFNSASLIFSLTLFISLPLALRISWEQRKTLAQEYANYKEQVAESNRALARGVHGYLMKNSRIKEVKQAITAAIEGRAVIDRRALSSLVISMNLTYPPQGDPWNELTDLEQRITKLVCRGYTNQEIADDLKYSLSNIKNTLTRIYQKMGVTTRTQLLVHAGHHNFPVLDN